MQIELRHIAGIVGLIAWAGWTNRKRIKSAAAKTWATLSPMAKGASRGWMVPLAIGGIVLWPDISKRIPWPSPAPIVEREPDIFDRAAASGRVLLADSIKEFAGTKYDSEQAAEDAMNEQILDCLEAAFGPVGKEIEKARAASRLTDMAAKIKAGELRDE